MASEQLYTLTFRNGKVVTGITGDVATEIFYEHQNTDNPCVVTLETPTYKAP